jgi:segregation and condensation protein B
MSQTNSNGDNFTMTESLTEFSLTPLEPIIEALLFVASGPVSTQELLEILHCNAADLQKALLNLENQYFHGRGIRLLKFEGFYQLTTAPEFAYAVERLIGMETTARLSRAGLEALAIIAYRQPITRPGVDSIRGVNSDGVIKSLLSKGLIEEMGRTETPGRPILYGTTQDFLQYFGLVSIDELPPFEILTQEGVSPEEQKLLKD